MNTRPSIAEMEKAYLGRDASYEGIFFVGVRTTAIFCRPTCPARSPLPRNVEYFATAAAALFAGYRPCKRCRPMSMRNEPEWAISLLADVEANPSSRVTEGELRSRGIDPATARRHFLRNYGMTFQAYARARRLSSAFTSIRSGSSLDGTAFDTGYESLSGFREAFERSFACTPGDCQHRDCVFLAWLPTPLGPLVAGATDAGICLAEFTDRRMLEAQFEAVRTLFRAPVLPGTNAHLDRLRRELDDYFAGTRRTFRVPLVYPGSAFQRRVWEQLLLIPYGETRSYHELASALGNPNAVRAVGRANGFNRISIVVPCHRVFNKNGDLGGYGGGLRRKQYLLNLEQVGVDKNA
ncbi:MAG: bifunctional transcriptional activator/DNA repair protein Ada [Burkholderiales bacterium]|nr:bifunctional transcriptional activator/DNA repair protein Ada [Burkholderiales bacterium]